MKLKPMRQIVFNIQFGHPLCDNVALKHLPVQKLSVPGVLQKRNNAEAFATMAQQR